MPFGDEWLDAICCPVEKHALRLMSPEEVASLNDAIAKGRATYSGGATVSEAVEGGLISADRTSLYGVRDGVPVLLPARRITVQDGGVEAANVPEAPVPADSPEALWEWLASVWKDRRPPARPAREDTSLLQRMVGEAFAGRPAPRVLSLGVTPEIATMRWPSGTRLLAIDASAAMIRKVWPAQDAQNAAVIRGDWVAMPLNNGVFDIVVGDASLGFQPYPKQFFGVLSEVRRVLRGGGLVVTRVYTRPESKEPLDAIFHDLHAGRIGTAESLWWRLYTAQHGDRAQGSQTQDVWRAWRANVPDPVALAESIGWPKGSVEATEGLKFSPSSMIFPTLREFREDLAGGFEEVSCEFPACEGGDRNPTMVLRAKP